VNNVISVSFVQPELTVGCIEVSTII